MKKGILILIVYCFSGGLCHGQNKKIDSLLQVLTTVKEDTAKVNTFNALADELGSNNPDTALYFATQALTLSTKINYDPGIADAYFYKGRALYFLGENKDALIYLNNALKLFDKLLIMAAPIERLSILKMKSRVCLNIGLVHNNQGEQTEALKNYFTSLKICQQIGDKLGLIRVYNNTGTIYRDQGNYTEALKCYFEGLKLSKELGNQQGISTSLTLIGLVYDELGKYPEALSYTFKALKIYEQSGDKRGKAADLNNIGKIYGEQKNFTEALANYSAALKLNEETGNKQWKAINLGNIGGLYKDQGNSTEALKYYFSALKIDIELGDKGGNAMNLLNIGSVYNFQKKYSEALNNHLTALKLFEELDDKNALALCLTCIGADYLELKNNIEASRYFNKGLSLAKEIGSLLRLQESYLALAALDSAQGNFKQAFEDHKIYITYRDSIVNKEAAKKTIQIQMQYEFDKKESLAKAEQEKKDALALKELQKQKLLRNFFIGTIGLVLVLFFFIYRTYRARQMLRLQDIRNKIAGDLHDDIGSTLNSISIYSEVAKKKGENYDEALEMIGDASRKVIEAMSDIVWTINAENDSFEKIIFRMSSLAYNLFHARNIEFTFHVDEILNEKKLSIEERRNFFLIFKEALNNLVKYSKATHASIDLTNENNRIRLRIRDDGVGFDSSKENAGNGLKNMKRRAEEMGAEFVIDSQVGGGTRIELTLKA